MLISFYLFISVDSGELLAIIWIHPTSARPIYYAKNGAGGICVVFHSIREDEIGAVVLLVGLMYKRVNTRA